MGVFLEQTLIQDEPNKEHPVVLFFKNWKLPSPSPPTYITLRQGKKYFNCLRGAAALSSQNSGL